MRFAALLAGLVAVAIALAPVASAHAVLLATDPARGAQLARSPHGPPARRITSRDSALLSPPPRRAYDFARFVQSGPGQGLLVVPVSDGA